MHPTLVLLTAALLLCACERAAAPPAANSAEAHPAQANAAEAWSAPAPLPAPAFPALTGRVVDEADLLTPEQENGFAARQAALERLTTDQFVIATVRSLEGRNIEDYARDLGNHWRLGQAEKDNGVLLLIAPNERQARIAVGLGLEHILTDEAAREIMERDLVPHFRRGEWQRGIDIGGRSIALVLGSQASTPRGRQ